MRRLDGGGPSDQVEQILLAGGWASRASGGLKRPGSAWGQRSGWPFGSGDPPPGSRLRDEFPIALENSLLERTTNTIAKIPRTGVHISFP
jgi:hypothetical protein